MSWGELCTRLQQEVGKRLDAGFHRLGLKPVIPQITAPERAPAKFFFPPDEIPGRIDLFEQFLPHEREALIPEADEICRHHFRLLGYKDVNYSKGADIDWHLDAVHDKRTPLIPWYKINFLDFQEAGDHKITWELNRHQHLVTLAKAWLLTHNEKYASEAIAQWYSWQRANPYPLGINWASSLEVAFRSLSWLWLRYSLADSPAVSDTFFADLKGALALNGRYIERFLSTYFSPNTHLIGEAVALFFIGTLCPEISASARWKLEGWRIIQEEAQRQVRPDGLYFEQSLYYHVYALDFFLHARILAARNGIDIPEHFDAVIRRMLAVVDKLSEVGPPDGFGDDDGGRVFNPHRNRAEHMTDPLVIGATLFPNDNLDRHSSLTEEVIWLFGSEAARASTPSETPLASGPFADSGLYVIADQHPIPQQAVLDAGPQGTGRSGHGHADALSMKLSFGGRRWLIDSGTFSYIGPGDERQRFRGTRAHNTLFVDERDQADPEGPFAWGNLPVTQTDEWIDAATFSFFDASHSGYERLPEPVRHRRVVFHPKGSFWLVRDIAAGRGLHSLETNWHFAPGIQVSLQTNAFIASTKDSQNEHSLGLIPVEDPNWRCEISIDQISPAYGSLEQVHVLRCATRVAAPAEHAMLLLPAYSREHQGKFSRLAMSAAAQDAPIVYGCDSGRASHRIVFTQNASRPWTFGPITNPVISDAAFLYYCLENQRITHLVCVRASFLNLHGMTVFSSPAPIQYLEWQNLNGRRHLYSLDKAAVDSFSEKALEVDIVV